ncbi:Uncharacterised protein [Mycobacteroides abscessus subsp. abscessus]|nr:Uncharacterised protein [Mycobacteroides abscessus subsp. abscessus]
MGRVDGALKARRKPESESENVQKARLWARQVRSVCEELFDNPFNAKSRAQLIELLVDKSVEADAFMREAISEKTSSHNVVPEPAVTAVARCR